MYSQRVVPELIELIYDAVSEPQQWPVFLESLARALHAVAGTRFTQDLGDQRLRATATVGVEPFFQHSYEAHYKKRNIYLMRGASLLKPGAVCASEMLCPDHEALRSEFYNDWIAPQGHRYGLMGVILKKQLLTSMIGLIRSKSTKPFGGAPRLFPELGSRPRAERLPARRFK